MKELPILFRGPMVHAILAGTKTQTRRVVKPHPTNVWGWGVINNTRKPKHGKFCAHVRGIHCGDVWVECPYGKPGDRLWVKENFHLGSYVKEQHAQGAIIAYAVGKSTAFKNMTDAEMARCRLKPDPRPWAESRTIPSLLMPRWASRITLSVTGVRVERLQDISEEDAMAEGCDQLNSGCYPFLATFMPPEGHWARRNYCKLWESINGPDSWALNPWVWVIQFNRITP